MKRMFFIVAMLAMCANVTVAQDHVRKGYVGIDVGPAFLLNSSSIKDIWGYEDVGVGIGFDADFGYLFTKNMGVSASFFSTSFPSKNSRRASDSNIGLMGFLVGPLFSAVSQAGKVQFDLRPTIGFATGTIEVGDQSGQSKSSTFSFGAGASVRWNAWDRISLSFNADYYYGKPKTDDTNEAVDLSSAVVSVGVNYRFK